MACIVTECLQEANGMVQTELKRLQEGLPSSSCKGKEEAKDAAPAANDNDYDPDDLAAAFFAQQAKQQQEEQTLPAKEWAETIFACCAHREKSSSGISTQEPVGSREEKEKLKAIQSLLLDFRKAIKGS